MIITMYLNIYMYNTIDPQGGHLGIFWVGECRPVLQIGTPF